MGGCSRPRWRPRRAPVAATGRARRGVRRGGGRVRLRRGRRPRPARPLPGLPALPVHRPVLPRLRRAAQRARVRARGPAGRAARQRARRRRLRRPRRAVAGLGGALLARQARAPDRPAAAPGVVDRRAAAGVQRRSQPAVRGLAAPLTSGSDVHDVKPAATGCEASALLRIPSSDRGFSQPEGIPTR
ncbi:hypothetical protein SGPA1_31309 [Streptomyces misionensis JCM 4497]